MSGVDPKTGEPWPTLLKYGSPSILPDVKEPGPSKDKKVLIYVVI